MGSLTAFSPLPLPPRALEVKRYKFPISIRGQKVKGGCYLCSEARSGSGIAERERESWQMTAFGASWVLEMEIRAFSPDLLLSPSAQQREGGECGWR